MKDELMDILEAVAVWGMYPDDASAIKPSEAHAAIAAREGK